MSRHTSLILDDSSRRQLSMSNRMLITSHPLYATVAQPDSMHIQTVVRLKSHNVTSAFPVELESSL